MAFNRDKFKATSTDVLKKKIKEEDETLGTGGGRSGYHEINDGSNKFRIYPKHPGSETFYEPKTVHWLTVEVDGQPKRRTVFNSVVHGGTKLDVCNEYIRMAKDHLQSTDDDEATEKLSKITDGQQGLLPSTVWVCYADKMTKDGEKTKKKFAQLELKKTMRDGMNKLSLTEDDDEAIVTDPFTDINDGKAVIISKEGSGVKTKYSVVLAKNPTKLTDEELEIFDKVKPLSELFRNVYKKSDFDLACDGLRYFDEENEIGLWETDEWEEMLEKIKKQYDGKKSPVSEKSSKDDKKSTKKASKPVDEDEENDEVVEEEEAEEVGEEEAESEEVDLDELDRAGLKGIIKSNSLDIIVKTSMSDDDIREAIRSAVAGGEEETEEEEEAEEEKPVAKKKEVKKPAKAIVEEEEETEESEEADEEVEEAPKAKPGAKSKVPSLDEIKAKLAKKVGKK